MAVEIRVLGPADEALLHNVDEDVFDDPLNAENTRVFLNDPRHHLVVAVDEGQVIGMASGVHYIHPDKPAPEMFINEVGVSGRYQGQGIGKRLMAKMLEVAKETGCSAAWVTTETSNTAARRLYESAGGELFVDGPVLYAFSLH
jgi:ribosomal protein S18 acetylase RimI-like enzyme